MGHIAVGRQAGGPRAGAHPPIPTNDTDHPPESCRPPRDQLKISFAPTAADWNDKQHAVAFSAGEMGSALDRALL